MFSITEDILELLVCDKCKKYLSVPPVKVYPDKSIYCGRCFKETDGGVVSLYDKIAQKSLFKCINKYDGCNAVLPYSQVSLHEENCKSVLYKCPNCPLAPQMTSFYLVHHFKEEHKDYFLNNSTFSTSANTRSSGDYKNYLYIKGDFLFIISVSKISKYLLILNADHIGNKLLSKEITQKFIVYSCDNNSFKKICTGTKPCGIYEEKIDGFTIKCNTRIRWNVDINLGTTKVQKLMIIPTNFIQKTTENNDLNTAQGTTDTYFNTLHLPRAFINRWGPQYSLSESENFLVNVNNKIINYCSFCQNKFICFSINQSIYKCAGKCSLNCGTFICSSCYFLGIKKCDNEEDYEFAPEETEVFRNVKYFCKWKCGEKYFSWNLRDHEYSCGQQRLSNCPVETCKWLGKFYEMKNHLNNNHQCISLSDTFTFDLNSVKIPKTCYVRNELIISKLNCFVALKWMKLSDKYVFSLRMNCCKNKYPVAVVSVNGKIDMFTEVFVLDLQSNSKLLIILRDV